jgi:PAS domain S-box-containing protein
MVHVTGWRVAWAFIAVAVLLMGVHRAMIVYDMFAQTHPAQIHLAGDLVVLVISALMLAGVALIGPMFASVQRNAEAARESESRYRAILDNMQDTYFHTDLDGRVIMASRSVEDLLGYTPEEIRGKKIADIYGDSEQRARFVRQLIAGGGEVENFESNMRRKNGELVWVSTTAHHYLDDQGKVTGIEGVTRNITEKRAAEAAMETAKEQAELHDHAKSEFLANMSHELRTPLNAILGFSDMIASQAFGPVQERHVRQARDIHDSGQHLLAIIDDILDLSKIEMGHALLEEEEVDLGELVDGCMRLLEERANRSQVVISADLDDVPPRLRADRRKLKQILLNLLTNSVKFTPCGGTVVVSARMNGADTFEIGVRDEGIGMRAEDIPKVLEPFGQVESADVRKYEGTGLGLPLAKSLAELHGGTLQIASSEGVGTTVTVRLPKERLLQ